MMRNTASVAAGHHRLPLQTTPGGGARPSPCYSQHAAFVDFSKAFDSVNHEALWEMLEARGIHPKLISLIKPLRGEPGAGGGAGGPVRVVLHTHWRETGLPPLLPYQWPGRKLSLGGAAQHADAPLRG